MAKSNTATQSSVDTTKTLTLVSSKVSSARKGPKVASGPTVLQQSADVWATMSDQQKGSYAALSAQMNDPLNPTLVKRSSAYSKFVELAGGCLATGQPILPNAPDYAPPPALPPMQLVAEFSNGLTSLKLVPTTAYPHAIAIKAARPVYASNTIYKSTGFKKIGSVANLGVSAELSSLFLAHYKVPSAGFKIGLEIMGVAPGGFRTSSLFVFGIVTNVSYFPALTDLSPDH